MQKGKKIGAVLLIGVPIALMFLPMCTRKINTTPKVEDQVRVNEAEKYVIFESGVYAGLVDSKAEAFHPDEAEIKEVLDLWAKAVEQHNNSEMVKAVAAEMLVILDPQKYYRQLVPTKVGDEHVYFVNSVCDPHGTRWKEDIILVKDGGSCYFQMKINFTKKEIQNFVINGKG